MHLPSAAEQRRSKAKPGAFYGSISDPKFGACPDVNSPFLVVSAQSILEFLPVFCVHHSIGRSFCRISPHVFTKARRPDPARPELIHDGMVHVEGHFLAPFDFHAMPLVSRNQRKDRILSLKQALDTSFEQNRSNTGPSSYAAHRAARLSQEPHFQNFHVVRLKIRAWLTSRFWKQFGVTGAQSEA